MRTGIKITAAMATALLFSIAAQAESRTYNLDGFDKLDIGTGLDAVVTQGDSFSVTATANSAHALENLELSVDKGVLTARFDQNFLDFIVSGGLIGMLLNSGNASTVEITMPELAGIQASAGAAVRVGALTSDELTLNASSGASLEVVDATLGQVHVNSSSGADVTLSGTADAIDADASSGADIDAGDLVARTATAGASSGADLSIHASQSVRANASSGGEIDIHGDPADREVEESGGGGVSFEN